MIRQETFSQGALVERIEKERLDSSTVEYRRYDSTLTLVEQRAATADEILRVDDQIDAEDREQKGANVSQAVSTLRQWAIDAAGTSVNNGNNTNVTQQVVDRLGIFFDRFADLIESKRLD